MGLETLPETTFTLPITLCVLTTSYRWAIVETSLRILTPQRRPGPFAHGLRSRNPASIPCSSTVPGLPRSKTFPKGAFESLPSQAHQRWAERPVQDTSLPLAISGLYTPAFVPHFVPFHRSAHRYCVWHPPAFAYLFPSTCFPFARLGTIGLLKGPARAKSLESTTFQILNFLNLHRRAQSQEQDLRPTPSRGFSSGQTFSFGRPEGWGVRDNVETPERESLRIGEPPSGVVPSTTYAHPGISWQQTSLVPSTSAGGVHLQRPALTKPAAIEEIHAALMRISLPVTKRGYGESALMTENLKLRGEDHVPDL